MIPKLLTIKEYCKLNQITDAAVRKQIKNKNINHCSYQNQTYIIIEDTKEEELKQKIKLLNSNIKALRNEIKQYTRQDDIIEEQKRSIEKLENKIGKLESKLEKQYEKKELLYEKVIGDMALLENKSKQLHIPLP